VAELDEIVVLARRSGAPMWTVTRGDSTLILVGAITGIPRDLAWRPDDLEAAAARSNQILSPQVGQASVSDIFRIIWRARTIGMMPRGQTTADYLTPDYQARLEAIMAEERNQDWRTESLLLVGFQLMQDKAGYRAGRSGDDAMDVIRRAARRARVPVRPALNQCWPWGDPEIAPQLRQQWAAAIETALVSPGVIMGVAPIRLLAEEGGVLDGLEARGFDVIGPEWK
jgi:hypothetical protein